MHGRPRAYKAKLTEPGAAAAHAKKVAAIAAGTSLVLACRAQHRHDAAALKASEKLLRVVPEIYTVWNFRREALEPVIQAGGEAGAAAAEAELALTQACLMENPKSYSTWHHRKWVVLHGKANLERELKLVTTVLGLDGRNFHAWNYRHFVVKLLGRPNEPELAYCSSLIAADFSNYSAWHYRTLLLPRLHGEDIATVSFDELMAAGAQQRSSSDNAAAGEPPAQPVQQQQQQQPPPQQQLQPQPQQEPAPQPQQPPPPPPQQQQQQPAASSGGSRGEAGGGAPPLIGCFTGSASQRRPIPLHVLDQEYDMVHQAFATDSGDQSPWIYYRWLLGNSLAHLQQAQLDTSSGGERARDQARAVLGEVLAREVARFSEALQQDPDAKWPLLMTAHLRHAQASLGLAEAAGLQPQALEAEVQQLYARLSRVDPMRAGFYADAARGRAFVVLQALGDAPGAGGGS